MKAQRERVAAVGRVELTPVAGTATDGGLGVVHTHYSRDPAEPFEGSVVSGQATQLILGHHPHHRVMA